MLAPRCLRIFSILLLFLSTFSTAWPWPRWLPEVDALIVRRDNAADSPSSTSSQADPTQQQSSTVQPDQSSTTSDHPTSTQQQSSTGQSGDKTTSSATSGSQSSQTTDSSRSLIYKTLTIVTAGHTKVTTETITPAPTSTVASSTTHVTYDATLPAGNIALVTPALIDGAQYYKVGANVTFAWNYTNVIASPTAVNILASCSDNNHMYTVATNQKVDSNSTGAVTWDTNAYVTNNIQPRLLTASYILIIYDAASSESATAEAGYLAPYNQYQFGMYIPQSYTPLSDFQCATCKSAALSEMERMALATVFGMGVITVLSFTWFVGGVGVIW